MADQDIIVEGVTGFAKWIGHGRQLGLKGAELMEFADQKHEAQIEREDRARQRDDERERRELDEQGRQRDRAHELEMLQRRHEAEVRAREDEARLLQLRVDAGRAQQAESNVNAIRAKLPKFEEGVDDIDSFLERFERFATAQRWPRDQWVISLSTLLTGKGLLVYSGMPADAANDYDALKTAILRRYQLTEEGFRVRFRDATPSAEKSVSQFTARMSRYCDRWFDLSGLEREVDVVFDLFKREQFLHVCSPELSVFLRERAPNTLAGVAEIAETYLEAHGGSIDGKRATESDSVLSRPKTSKLVSIARKRAI